MLIAGVACHDFSRYEKLETDNDIDWGQGDYPICLKITRADYVVANKITFKASDKVQYTFDIL